MTKSFVYKLGLLILTFGIMYAVKGVYCLKHHPQFKEENEQIEMKQLSKSQHNDTIARAIRENKNVIIQFYRPGCPYCKYLAPHFNQLQQKLNGSGIHLLQVDISSNSSYYKKTYGFKTVPTVIYFKNGREQARNDSGGMGTTVDHMYGIAERVYSK